MFIWTEKASDAAQSSHQVNRCLCLEWGTAASFHGVFCSRRLQVLWVTSLSRNHYIDILGRTYSCRSISWLIFLQNGALPAIQTAAQTSSEYSCPKQIFLVARWLIFPVASENRWTCLDISAYFRDNHMAVTWAEPEMERSTPIAQKQHSSLPSHISTIISCFPSNCAGLSTFISRIFPYDLQEKSVLGVHSFRLRFHLPLLVCPHVLTCGKEEFDFFWSL